MAASRWSYVNTSILVLIYLKVAIAGVKLPEKILCADTKCRAPLSRVQTIFNYESPDPHYLSFSQHDVIQVFGKDVGEDDMWTGELVMKPGRIGLFNKKLVKELVVFNKTPQEHVDTLDFFEARAPHILTVTKTETGQSDHLEGDEMGKDNVEGEGAESNDLESNVKEGPDQSKPAEEQAPDEEAKEFKAVLVEEDEDEDMFDDDEDDMFEDDEDDEQDLTEPEHEEARTERDEEDVTEIKKDNEESSPTSDTENQDRREEDGGKEDEKKDKANEDMKENQNDDAATADVVTESNDEVNGSAPQETNLEGTENNEKQPNEDDGVTEKDDTDKLLDDVQLWIDEPNKIQPSPSFEVIDGTTIYIDDLEPTPMPGNSASRQPPHQANMGSSSHEPPSGEDGKAAVFSMHAIDIVDFDPDLNPAPSPTVFSVKSEDEIDPKAYQDILHKLHATPGLQNNKDAIQQEMLKILRDPELKKNLLVKSRPPPPQKQNILSPFLHTPTTPTPPTGADAVHQQQDQQPTDSPSHEEASDNPGNDAEQDVPPPPPVGPGKAESNPNKHSDPDDPLAILDREGVSPEQFSLPPGSVPIPAGDQSPVAVPTMTSDPHHDTGQQDGPGNVDDSAYDPASVETGQTPHSVPSVDPTHVAKDPPQEDPAQQAAATVHENQPLPVQSSPEGSVDPPEEPVQDDPVPSQESNPEPVSVEVNKEVPPPQLDPSLPVNPDLQQDLDGQVGNKYGEPGIRTSTRLPLQVNEEEEEVVPNEEEVVVPDEEQLPVENVDVVVADDDGNITPEDIYIDEGYHHQLYTKEENGEEFDDGVTIEEEKEEEIPVVNDTSGDWLTHIMENLQPAMTTLQDSVLLPVMNMLPAQLQREIQQPDFLGIPWVVVLSIEITFLGLIFLLTCCWLCNSRSSRSMQEVLIKEVETLTAQKAEVLDTLEMTNTQFQKQNLEYFELKSATDSVHRDKSKLEKNQKKLTQAVEEQKGEMEKIKAALKKKSTESEANHQKIKSLEQQVKKSQNAVTDLTSKIQDLEGKVYTGEQERSHLSEEIASLEEQNQQLASGKNMLEEEITGWHERVSELTEQIQLLTAEKKDFEESVTFKDNEIEVLKDCLLQLKGLQSIHKEGTEVDSEAKIQQLMDVTRVNAKLSLVLKERDELQEKLDSEIHAERELETKMGSMEQELDGLRMKHSKAKTDYDEAQTKLEVLQEYFKSKEVELQRKLGREEALKLQTAEQVSTLSEKAVSAEIDLNNYRQQIADLKSELEKAERNFRTQIAAHEKKSHESWLASRAAERELQESKREAATLRHRLTELEGRRATSENAPLVKPQAAAPSPLRVVSPSFRPGDRSGRPGRRGGPSRNSLIAEDSPSPPHIDPRHRESVGELRPRMSPPMMDRDMPRMPPDDFIPPPMHGGPSPFGREPLRHPDFGPPGPFPPEDDLGPYGPPPPGHPHRDFPPDYPPHPDDLDFGPHGPPPPGMDFGPPPRLPPPGRGSFDGPLPPMDPGFNPRFGPPPPGMDPRERFPPPMHGPGPYPGEGPPMDRRGPPPPHPGMRPGSRTGPLGPPDGPMGPRTSSPMVPDGTPPPKGQSPRGPPSRQPPNMQA